MSPFGGSGATPQPEMKIEVTDLNLTVGAILEAADVFTVPELRRVCEFTLSLAGRSLTRPLPTSEEGFRDILTSAVEFLRDNQPRELTKVEEFVDGIARERYKANRAKFRKSARESAGS
jgi:hypothetical protein